MSKDTPEVGDVFYVRPFTHLKRIITYKIEYKNIITYVVFDGRQTYETSLSRIKKEFTYLGKSKANIDDLFKTENEERCIEDNIPHTESTVLFKDLENEE